MSFTPIFDEACIINITLILLSSFLYADSISLKSSEEVCGEVFPFSKDQEKCKKYLKGSFEQRDFMVCRELFIIQNELLNCLKIIENKTLNSNAQVFCLKEVSSKNRLECLSKMTSKQTLKNHKAELEKVINLLESNKNEQGLRELKNLYNSLED